MSRPDDLETLVRDAAPRPRPEFLESLDARVGERFGAPERPHRAWPRGRLGAGLAAAGALAAVVVVAVAGSGTHDSTSRSSGSTAGGAAAASESARAPAAPKPAA